MLLQRKTWKTRSMPQAAGRKGQRFGSQLLSLVNYFSCRHHQCPLYRRPHAQHCGPESVFTTAPDLEVSTTTTSISQTLGWQGHPAQECLKRTQSQVFPSWSSWWVLRAVLVAGAPQQEGQSTDGGHMLSRKQTVVFEGRPCTRVTDAETKSEG